VPAIALERAMKKAGLGIADLGLVEINEAFAAVPIHSARMLDVDDELVNVNGGAVALGHPIGASGARIVWTLILEMRRRGVELGGAAICGGGGQGDALVLRAT
jgi:acetyl-CoA C-acetyltransferase